MRKDWEPVLDRLVVPELEAMERTARFDRAVLLWIQESYAKANLKASGVEDDAPLTPDSVAQNSTAFHAAEKRAGRGIDLIQYLSHARQYWDFMAARRLEMFGAYVDGLEKDLADGKRLDVVNAGGGVYLHMARVAGVAQELERNRRGKRCGAIKASQECLQALDGLAERISRLGKTGAEQESTGQKILRVAARLSARSEGQSRKQSKEGSRGHGDAVEKDALSYLELMGV